MFEVVACPACGADTFIVVSEAGNRIRVEPGRVDDGTIIPVTVDGAHRARVLTGDALPADGGAWRDHRKTCGRSVDRWARCPWCQNLLDPWLVEHGYRGHVLCIPMTREEAETGAPYTPPAERIPA